MPFSNLLLFGDRGNGDLFAYPIQVDGVIHNHDVFVWDHEADARSWFAGSLRAFLVEAFRGIT
jgi:SMI1-KNR4 cell-wall